MKEHVRGGNPLNENFLIVLIESVSGLKFTSDTEGILYEYGEI
jgi:hypothetical protein